MFDQICPDCPVYSHESLKKHELRSNKKTKSIAKLGWNDTKRSLNWHNLPRYTTKIHARYFIYFSQINPTHPKINIFKTKTPFLQVEVTRYMLDFLRCANSRKIGGITPNHLLLVGIFLPSVASFQTHRRKLHRFAYRFQADPYGFPFDKKYIVYMNVVDFYGTLVPKYSMYGIFTINLW